MAEAIGGSGQVGIITGFFAVEAHELRRQGFVDTLAAEYPDIEIVGEVENTDQGDIAYTQAQDFMTANPDLELVSTSPPAAPSALLLPWKMQARPARLRSSPSTSWTRPWNTSRRA